MAAVDISFDSWPVCSFHEKKITTFQSSDTLLASKSHSIFVTWCRIFEHHNVENSSPPPTPEITAVIQGLHESFIYPSSVMIETSIFMIWQRKQVKYRNKGSTYKYLFCLIRRWKKIIIPRDRKPVAGLSKRPWNLSCTQYFFDSYNCSCTGHRFKSLKI